MSTFVAGLSLAGPCGQTSQVTSTANGLGARELLTAQNRCWPCSLGARVPGRRSWFGEPSSLVSSATASGACGQRPEENLHSAVCRDDDSCGAYWNAEQAAGRKGAQPRALTRCPQGLASGAHWCAACFQADLTPQRSRSRASRLVFAPTAPVGDGCGRWHASLFYRTPQPARSGSGTFCGPLCRLPSRHQAFATRSYGKRVDLARIS